MHKYKGLEQERDQFVMALLFVRVLEESFLLVSQEKSKGFDDLVFLFDNSVRLVLQE